MKRWLTVAICLGLIGRAAAEEGEGQVSPKARWIAVGRVTDGQGNGVTSATVTANTGRNTLTGGGSATTDSEGRYRLLFGPGIIFTARGKPWGKEEMERTPLQAAVIRAGKSGYYEQNLSRQGDLRMAGTKDKVSADDPRRDKVFFPDDPRRVDFVLMPAAELRARVVDAKGKPVANMKFDIVGDEVGPSASALAMVTTDPNGEFRLKDVPCKAYRIDPWERPKYDYILSDLIPFPRPGVYEVDLTLDPAKRTLSVRVISAPKE